MSTSSDHLLPVQADEAASATEGEARGDAPGRTVETSGPSDAEPTLADRLLAQRLLAILGRLGASVHAALVARVDPSIVGNIDVLVLATLDIEGSLRPTQIRDLTGMSSGGVTKLLDRLEGHGLVARRFGEVRGDRRGSEVVLTREGREVAGRLAEGIASRIDIVHGAIAELSSLTRD